jgi:hypothetical protein
VRVDAVDLLLRAAVIFIAAIAKEEDSRGERRARRCIFPALTARSAAGARTDRGWVGAA